MKKVVSCELVCRVVSEYFGIPQQMLFEFGSTRRAGMARKVAWSLAYDLCNMSWADVSGMFCRQQIQVSKYSKYGRLDEAYGPCRARCLELAATIDWTAGETGEKWLTQSESVPKTDPAYPQIPPPLCRECGARLPETRTLICATCEHRLSSAVSGKMVATSTGRHNGKPLK